MQDIILFNGALNSSLFSGPYTAEVNTAYNNTSILKLAPATALLELKYNFDELMLVGEYTFEEFLEFYQPQQCYIIIYNCSGEIKPLVIHAELYYLLQSFTGTDSLAAILEKHPAINSDEAHEFIAYALAESIVFCV